MGALQIVHKGEVQTKREVDIDIILTRSVCHRYRFCRYFHSDTGWGDSSGIFHTGRLLDAKDYVVRYTTVERKGYDRMPLSTLYGSPRHCYHHEGVERYFYWPRLKKDVKEFVRSCLVCQKVKFDRHKAQGFLQPLPIPTRLWESIAMDFIFDLPRTQSHDGIWTIIDRFSKQARFIPVKRTVKPDHLARLFVAQIFRLHGMPETIVSDRDPRFTSLFWKAIWENIGTRLQFSSSFHPQTDGQSEIANSVVLDLLKSYISDQKTQWERYLPLMEFTYNNTIHSSTGKTSFEIVEGAMKVPPFLSTKDKIFEADEYTRDLDTAFAKVRETLQKSQELQKKAADRHRRDLKLKENDWVLLRFEKTRVRKKKGKERFFPKLSIRYYGPFQITERINDVSFRLRLPDTWKIHNAFHVSLLKPFKGDVPDEQPEVEENEEILVPEQILTHKDTKNKGKVRRWFLVKFKNYPALDAKWMEEEDLADTPQIVKRLPRHHSRTCATSSPYGSGFCAGIYGRPYCHVINL
ncbi:hypothetical protein L7F22_029343 [Adiantum nelumboides]|nr:hypothetical protein [Adiantum nelumboides]